jgi:hypothetical protein
MLLMLALIREYCWGCNLMRADTVSVRPLDAEGGEGEGMRMRISTITTTSPPSPPPHHHHHLTTTSPATNSALLPIALHLRASALFER